MIRSVDYLVVGQGLAGSLLANLLLERGKKIMVYDQGHQSSSTRNAAGIINPVTGRRFVKSWMFDKLMPSALEQYRRLEKLLGVDLIRRLNIVRSLPDQKALNDWLMKADWEDYQDYVVRSPDLTTFQENLNLEGLWCEVTGSFQIDLPLLISQMRQYLKSGQILREEFFDTNRCQFSENKVTYADLETKHIIFAEGASMMGNPIFPGEHFLNPSKGENLLLRIPDFYPTKMIKKKYFLAHLKEDMFWFGAKDGWHFTEDSPSEEGRNLLSSHAATLLKLPYKVIEHRAAIRPTIKDRRPVIGKHSTLERVYLFNGLGTKGSSLAPYWAEQLIKHIEEDISLGTTVDPRRFSNDWRP